MNMRIFTALLLTCALSAHAKDEVVVDEETQIVTTCHYANAEWGNDMIHLCVAENRRLRNEVLSLDASHAGAVARCRANSELGWEWVKSCVMKDAGNRSEPAR